MTDIKLHDGQINPWQQRILLRLSRTISVGKKILLIRLLSGWLRRGRFAGMNLALFAGLRFQRRPSSFLKQSIF